MRPFDDSPEWLTQQDGRPFGDRECRCAQCLEARDAACQEHANRVIANDRLRRLARQEGK